MDRNFHKQTLKTSSKKSAARELVDSFPQAEKDAWEAQLQRAAERLKQRYSHIPFYAARAKNNPGYWRDLASSEVNA
ncbi:hypothetical protein [Teredinibacter turnerae]|uniref:hypothetical protein n=1 Tax=Teredinibacter turnerae TaxID=2426 RepID=UPI0003653636|nr:hypothetical protein [Teredinibacter turnerae]